MQSSLPRNLYELDPTQGEIEWRKYLQNIEMEKKAPKSYAADYSESHFDPAALPIIGRFEQRIREAENVTTKNIFSPTNEIPVSQPRGAAVQPESKIGRYMKHMLRKAHIGYMKNILIRSKAYIRYVKSCFVS